MQVIAIFKHIVLFFMVFTFMGGCDQVQNLLESEDTIVMMDIEQEEEGNIDDMHETKKVIPMHFTLLSTYSFYLPKFTFSLFENFYCGDFRISLIQPPEL